jgi:hypothetical protein
VSALRLSSSSYDVLIICYALFRSPATASAPALPYSSALWDIRVLVGHLIEASPPSTALVYNQLEEEEETVSSPTSTLLAPAEFFDPDGEMDMGLQSDEDEVIDVEGYAGTSTLGSAIVEGSSVEEGKARAYADDEEATQSILSSLPPKQCPLNQ